MSAPRRNNPALPVGEMPNGLEKFCPKIDEVARQQMVLVKRRCVAVQAALVLQPALDEVEGDLRQPPLGHAVQIFDVDGLIHSHRADFSLQRCHWAKLLRQSYCVSAHISTIRNYAGLGCAPVDQGVGSPQ
jgi:hypothetical protein